MSIDNTTKKRMDALLEGVEKKAVYTHAVSLAREKEKHQWRVQRMSQWRGKDGEWRHLRIGDSFKQVGPLYTCSSLCLEHFSPEYLPIPSSFKISPSQWDLPRPCMWNSNCPPNYPNWLPYVLCSFLFFFISLIIYHLVYIYTCLFAYSLCSILLQLIYIAY